MSDFSWSGAIAQGTELLLAVLLAPLLTGWVNQCRAWLQNRTGPGVLRPYLVLRKLVAKDAIVADGASPLFRVTPYVLFGCMCMAAAIVPTFCHGTTRLCRPARKSSSIPRSKLRTSASRSPSG